MVAQPLARAVALRFHQRDLLRLHSLLTNETREETQAKTYYTDFRWEAECRANGHSSCVPVSKMPDAIGRLRNRTIVLMGDSVLAQFHGFLSCWLLSEAVKAGHSDTTIAAESAAWISSWHAALRERAKALGVRSDHPVIKRALGGHFSTWASNNRLQRDRMGRFMQLSGSAISIPNGPTLAFVNNRLYLPHGISWSQLTADWYLPALAADQRKSRPRLSTGGRHHEMAIAVNFGLHANIADADDPNSAWGSDSGVHGVGGVTGATASLAADYANVTTSFLLAHAPGHPRWTPTATHQDQPQPQQYHQRLLMLETVPQHFATPTGLYANGIDRQPCVPIAKPTHPAANWRNVALRRGVKWGVEQASRAAGLGPSKASSSVQIVPVWQALSEMSGVDCHAHHFHNPIASPFSTDLLLNNGEEGDIDERAILQGQGGKVTAVSHDCTHLSPDALLFMSQALVASVLSK